MSRRSGNRELPQLERVEKIELSDKNIGWRLSFFILFVVIAATAFASCVNSFFSKDPGWYQIETNSSDEAHCGNEFIFMYNLGLSQDATKENRALTILYTEACEMAHKLFHNKETFEGVNNVCYINQHPNEVIEVDSGLYKAFSVIDAYENRNLYMAPVYSQYDEIFLCQDDSQLVNFDPRMSEEVAAEYAEIATYANNPEMVDVKLLGDNKIQLYVSEEYLAYAEENYITEFIDFFWMKNAFVTDYLAETMIEKGYTHGTLTSYDGFSRTMDTSENSYSFNIYDRVDETLYPAGVMQYQGANSLVYFRDHMLSDMDWQHYYALSNGEVRNSYVDVTDGVSKAATDSYYVYAKDMSCAEVLLKAIPVYVTEEWSEDAVAELAAAGIYSVYAEDGVVKYNDTSLVVTELLDEEEMKYTAELVK